MRWFLEVGALERQLGRFLKPRMQQINGIYELATISARGLVALRRRPLRVVLLDYVFVGD